MPRVPPSTYSNDNLPQGVNRADGEPKKNGVGYRLGTKTSGRTISTPGGKTTPDDIPINELPDSPTIERAEQGTVTHKYTMSYTEALNRCNIYGRGQMVVDEADNYWRVLSSTVQYVRGDSAILTIVAESISFDVPPDEFQIQPVKLNIDITKHPRYYFALTPTAQIPTPWPSWLKADTDTQQAAKQAILRVIQAYRDTPWMPQTDTTKSLIGIYHDDIQAMLSGGKFIWSVPNPNYEPQFTATLPPQVGETFDWDDGTLAFYPQKATASGQDNPRFYYKYTNTTETDPGGKIQLALAAAQEIINKLWRMEDSPLVNGVEITWSSYYFRPPWLNLGSYLENPIDNKTGVPDYFWSTTWPPNGAYTIFDNLAAYAPQIYSLSGTSDGLVTISWLRDADTIEYQRTWFRVTRKWLGAPIGSWDKDIYSSNNRPRSPDEYNVLIYPRS
jgi:hypothetical protein